MIAGARGGTGTRGVDGWGWGVGRRSRAGLAAKAGLSEPPVSVRSANLAATRAVFRAGTGLPSDPDTEPVSADSGSGTAAASGSGTLSVSGPSDLLRK